MFTVVIPFFNGHQYLDRLLTSIPDNIPVLLVDDQSEKPLIEVSHPNVQIIRVKEKGYFTGAVNQGIRACNTDVLILNQDTYFTDDNWLNWIEEQVKNYDLFGERAGSHPAWSMRYIHGTFMYVKREVVNKTGLLDTDNYPLWGSTCEYQLRACRKGFKANPVKTVPSFVHKRRGPYGSAILETLNKTGNRGKLIKTPPLVSVIITNYNYGRYLPDAINSLIGGKTSLGEVPGQSLQSFEVIILDDGSTDNSIEIAEKLADSFKGIHLVRQQNKGSAAAVNAGIMASHARKNGLIAVMDADDMFEPERLERMVQTYQDNPHSVIYDNIQYFGNGQRGVITDWETGKKINRLNLKGYDFEQQLLKNKMHKGLLYPKKAWEEAGGYPEIMNQGREDWAFNVALGIKGWCGVNTGGYEYLYRREGQNRTLTNTTPRHYRRFLEQIQSIFPDIYEGHRPKMCCGRAAGKNAAASSNGRGARTMKQDLPGQEGMVILEYVGNNSGDETWHGPVTKTVYRLGGVQKKGYVDKRDASKMIAFRDRGKNLFVETQPKEEPVVEIKKSLPGGELQKAVLSDVEYTEMLKTVGSINEVVSTLLPQELETLLSKEQQGKNRASAIKAIEAQLERVV